MTDGCHAQAAPIAAHDRSFALVTDAAVWRFYPQLTPGMDGTEGRIDRAEDRPITFLYFLPGVRQMSDAVNSIRELAINRNVTWAMPVGIGSS